MSSFTPIIPLPSTAQAPHQPILFDPDGEVKTSDRLKAVMHDVRGPMINNYVRHRQIGKGQHGEVYLCKQLNTKFPPGHPQRHIPVAMKSVKRNNPREEQSKKLRRSRFPASTDHTPVADKLNTVESKIKKEIAIMKKLIHPNVVRLYEVIDDRMYSKIYIVMEYLGGGEIKWRDEMKNPVLTVSQTRRIFRDVILGLEYLHNQGIIHRDIKPANLLWTEDRRQVKIADFGVSHFSYAQRLAAAGDAKIDDDPDLVLLDDSGLSRRAGTPSFLAPEVVYEHTNIILPSSTSRPPITKAIDVWALGVTLYCLLFGRVPFSTPIDSEYALYQVTCNEDWGVEPVMGSDKISTGGRFPKNDSEGAKIIHLLDQMLQKNPKRRVSLSNVKTNPWVLTDLRDPEYWLKVTLKPEKINVSVKETSGAMSAVHFRHNWSERIARHVTSFFRRSPPSNGLPRLVIDGSVPVNGKDQQLPSAVLSDPVGHRVFSSPADTNGSSTPLMHHNLNGRRDKGKCKTLDSPQPVKQASFNSNLNSKSINRLNTTNLSESLSRDELPSTATTTAQLANSNFSSRDPKSRRGSISRTIERVASGSLSMFGSASGASSPKQLSPGGSTVGGLSGEKKTRFINILQNISAWRPNKFASASTARREGPPKTTDHGEYEHVTSTDRTRSLGLAAGAAAAAGQGPNSRRSEEALRYYRHQQYSEDTGVLTAARRASSWGLGDRELNDMVSVQSVEQILTDQVMNVGAGGLCSTNIPPIPRVTSSELAATYSNDNDAQEGDDGDDNEEVSGQEEVSIQDSESAFAKRYGLPVEHDDWSSLQSFEDKRNPEEGEESTAGDEEIAVPVEVVQGGGFFQLNDSSANVSSEWDDGGSLCRRDEEDEGDEFEEEDDYSQDEDAVTFSPRPRRQHHDVGAGRETVDDEDEEED